MASDAEVNIVIVTLLCPDSKKETMEQVVALIECIRTHQLIHNTRFRGPHYII
jgi:hypothetical protein